MAHLIYLSENEDGSWGADFTNGDGRLCNASTREEVQAKAKRILQTEDVLFEDFPEERCLVPRPAPGDVMSLLHADEIWPGFWLGSAPLPHEIPPKEFVVVCFYPNLTTKHPEGVHLAFGGWVDREGAVPPKEEMERVCESVHPYIEEGRPTFWHCQAGLNRSALALAYYMCSRRGMAVEMAIRTIREKRKTHAFAHTALFNQSFCAALREWFPGPQKTPLEDLDDHIAWLKAKIKAGGGPGIRRTARDTRMLILAERAREKLAER